MVKTKWWIALALLAIVLIVTVPFLGRKISGGAEMFGRVAKATESIDLVIGLTGTPNAVTEDDSGPSEVSVQLSGDRLHDGYYSAVASGPKGVIKLKIIWRERANKDVEVIALYRRNLNMADEFLWGKRQP